MTIPFDSYNNAINFAESITDPPPTPKTKSTLFSLAILTPLLIPSKVGLGTISSKKLTETPVESSRVSICL